MQVTEDIAPSPPRPFLKWAGGKARLAPQIMARFPARFRRYHEPFVGGGAVFFALGPRRAVVSDINAELILTYRAIRDDLEALIRLLRRHRATERVFYRARALDSRALSPVEAAARTIFLNRTCFNGLYRVNRQGRFNVPYGRYSNPTICDPPNLRAVSRALQDVDLRVQDALTVGPRARPGDLVYFDPPYDPTSTTASFTSYTKNRFGRPEQEQLAHLFADLAERGVHVVLSNSNTPFIRKLYRRFNVETVYARRSINCRGGRRGPVPELIVSTA